VLLNLPELATLFEGIEAIINGIRLIGTRSSYMYNAPVLADVERTAEDLVDLVLHGSINMAFNRFSEAAGGNRRPYYWELRASYYKQAPRTDGDGSGTD
jgi:hypothetical protein